MVSMYRKAIMFAAGFFAVAVVIVGVAVYVITHSNATPNSTAPSGQSAKSQKTTSASTSTVPNADPGIISNTTNISRPAPATDPNTGKQSVSTLPLQSAPRP